jgi:hypothetical protein
LLGDGFTKTDNSISDEFTLKKPTNRLYTSTYKDKKEDLLSIEDFKKEGLVQIQSKNEYNYYFRNINKDQLTPITSFKTLRKH